MTRKTTDKTEDKTAKTEEAPKPKPEPTKGDVIWDTIKNLGIEMYALPDQTVDMHCRRVVVEPEKVHVLLKSTAVLPALEGVLRTVKLDPNEMFDISQAAHFTVISIIPKAPVPMSVT